MVHTGVPDRESEDRDSSPTPATNLHICFCSQFSHL